MVFKTDLSESWLLFCGVLKASVCIGELKDMCLGWSSCVMASMTDVDAY